MGEIADKAKYCGINIDFEKTNKIDLIRLIQRKEGFDECFFSHKCLVCENVDCCFFSQCRVRIHGFEVK